MLPIPPLPPATEQRLRVFAAILETWTRRINLVSAADSATIWTRHVGDSLRLLPLVPPGTVRAIDLGSGGGLPGLVLAIAGGVPFDLVESDQRKAAFLREAARETAAPATVHAVRIEACGLPPASLVTARALAPLPGLLALAAPLLRPGGTMLFPKGVRAADEIGAAEAEWDMVLERLGSPDSPVLRITAPRRREAVHG